MRNFSIVLYKKNNSYVDQYLLEPYTGKKFKFMFYMSLSKYLYNKLDTCLKKEKQERRRRRYDV